MLISGFREDNPRVTSVTNQAVGCHYFLSGPRLSSQLQRFTALGRHQFIPLVNRRICVNHLPMLSPRVSGTA